MTAFSIVEIRVHTKLQTYCLPH